ncbi:MAG: hypothetical protein WBW03_29135, partial [Silvibacterium sp.]
PYPLHPLPYQESSRRRPALRSHPAGPAQAPLVRNGITFGTPFAAPRSPNGPTCKKPQDEDSEL